MSKIMSRIKRMFRKRHPDIYEATKKYAEGQGLRIDDVIGAGLSSYLSTTSDGKEALENAIEERGRKGGGSSTSGMEEALQMFERMVDTSVKLMTKSQEAGQQLIKGSLLTELKSQAETIEAIKSIGAEGGKGSIEDVLATAFVNRLLEGKGISFKKKTTKKKKKSGKGKVVEIEEEQ